VEFKTKAQEQTYQKVGEYLGQSFGSTGFAPHPELPSYVGTQGSCMVEVTVYPWTNDAVVNIRSCLVMDIGELQPQLLRFLLDENFKFVFGGFSLDPNGDINFEETLLGSMLDRDELEKAVGAVLATSDDYDNRIVSQYGGVTGREKFLAMAKEAGFVS
jgi:hypothetical protein